MEGHEKDKWQEALEEQIVILKKCQNEHLVDSCLKCKEVLDCRVHDIYVNAVYESMNKGSGGGFEF